MSGLIARVRAALQGFGRHKVPRLAAALAFYTLISLAPLLVVLVAVVGVALALFAEWSTGLWVAGTAVLVVASFVGALWWFGRAR